MGPWKERLEQYNIPIGLILIGLVLVIGSFFIPNKSSERVIPKESVVQIKNLKFFVDISGAVNKPGVYEVDQDTRIDQVIELAGGLNEKVNNEYVSKYLNKAQKVSDGIKIYIPFADEKLENLAITQNVKGLAKVLININSASAQQLESLSGIGPATAQKIIDGRPYETVDQLLSKKVLGKAVFEKLKEGLTAQ